MKNFDGEGGDEEDDEGEEEAWNQPATQGAYAQWDFPRTPSIYELSESRF